ncbi:GNAT family N-acetyltransferase [Curtobacterium sp. MCPF17_002]|uniref:lipid II:glycine glycyltransferase FemX n=1 Tax=Curtobacterium sp. MCPF17_002 TaxID=2175645 RepID=UPI000DA87A59|nr:GNAT family N-acetyltransferase [Curtobacterium sp. MCPF17_002]WIB79171.1 GNAT family N-acetyltransferase [Curtobacterium sp. MCPF17_002]
MIDSPREQRARTFVVAEDSSGETSPGAARSTHITFTRATSAAEWDPLVAASPGATGFHDWSWLRLMADVFGWTFHPLVVHENGRSVGVFPVLMRPSLLPRPAEPPFPYVGPLVPDALLGATIGAFRRWQIRHGRPFVRFEFGPGSAEAARRTFTGTRADWKPDRTIIVDLAGCTPETLTAGMKKGARHALRTAERNDVRIRPSLPGELTELLPDVLGEAYTSRGVPSPYPDDIGARIEAWAVGRDDVYIATAIVGDESVGALVALAGHPVVTGWAGGSLRAHRAANPSTALYHDMLQWALRRGHTSVDLVGYVDEGISRFKKSFGGVEQPYLTVISSLVPDAVLSAGATVRRSTRSG